MTVIQVYFGKPVTSTQKGIGLRPSATGCREGGGGQRRRRAVGSKPGEHIFQRKPIPGSSNNRSRGFCQWPFHREPQARSPRRPRSRILSDQGVKRILAREVLFPRSSPARETPPTATCCRSENGPHTACIRPRYLPRS